jgi:hypothetical protein
MLVNFYSIFTQNRATALGLILAPPLVLATSTTTFQRRVSRLLRFRGNITGPRYPI